MKLAKTAFILALFNFLIVAAVIVNSKQPELTEANKIGISPTTTPVKKVVKKTITPKTVAPANQTVTSTTTADAPVAAPTTDNRCIIVVDGARYDISSFRNLHSGGNIFQCGSDMSAVFHQQHDNSYLGRMSQYKI